MELCISIFIAFFMICLMVSLISALPTRGRNTHVALRAYAFMGKAALVKGELGSCISAAFARCVEPLPLLEGLAVFRSFELC